MRILFIPLLFLSINKQDLSAAVAEGESNVRKEILVTLTTDLDDVIYPLELSTDSQGTILEAHVNGDRFPVDIFLEKVHHGMVLQKAHGMKVVTLYGPQLHATHGGDLEIVYLADAIWKNYRRFKMTLEREETDGSWALYTQGEGQEKERIQQLHILVKRFFGLPIGIKKLIVNP